MKMENNDEIPVKVLKNGTVKADIPETPLSPAQQRCFDKIELLHLVPKFRERIWEIQTQWGIPEGRGFGEIKCEKAREESIKKFLEKLKTTNKADEFFLTILVLCEEFNLTKRRYFNCLTTRIISGALWTPIYCEPTIRYELNKTSKERELCIEIYGDTTLTDIKRIWKQVKGIQKGLPDFGDRYRRPSKKQINIICRILAAREQGVTYQEIWHRMFPELSKKTDYTYLPKLMHRFEKSLVKGKAVKPSQ